MGVSAGTWVGENSTGDAGVFFVGVARSTRIDHPLMHRLYQRRVPLRAAVLVPKGDRKPRWFRSLEPLFRSLSPDDRIEPASGDVDLSTWAEGAATGAGESTLFIGARRALRAGWAPPPAGREIAPPTSRWVIALSKPRLSAPHERSTRSGCTCVPQTGPNRTHRGLVARILHRKDRPSGRRLGVGQPAMTVSTFRLPRRYLKTLVGKKCRRNVPRQERST